MSRQLCQSCGMPLKDDNRGIEANGDTSEKYCTYCYQGGEFTWKDVTADQMQIYCTGILMKRHWPGFAAKWATHSIPDLERWSKV